MRPKRLRPVWLRFRGSIETLGGFFARPTRTEAVGQGLEIIIVKKTGCSLRAFRVLGNGLAAELPNCPPDLLSLRFHTCFILVSYPVSYLNRPFQVPPQICQPQILALCMKTPQVDYS